MLTLKLVVAAFILLVITTLEKIGSKIKFHLTMLCASLLLGAVEFEEDFETDYLH